VHEMKSYIAREDVEQWEPLIQWLEKPVAARESVQPTPAIVTA
jgi:hypothetical protein